MINDPVYDYCQDVLTGKILTGHLVKLACKRHLRDLEDGRQRGLHWNVKAAMHAINFFRFLRLPDRDEPFRLLPFQKFIVGSLFGWKKADGFRRFRTAYIEIGKGNTKTPLGAAIGLYGMVADGEQAAEVYPVANTVEQARICFLDAQRIAEKSTPIRNLLDIQKFNLAHHPTNSCLRAISPEKRGLDGKRIHIAIIDEIHEHRSAETVKKVRLGTKGRNQALIIEITNSGYDRTSICWEHHQYSVRVLEGELNDSWFAYVCNLDPCQQHRNDGMHQPFDGCPHCDDWKDESVWPKTNPALGIAIQPDYLREAVQEATGMPSIEDTVKRLNFCIWTETIAHAISMDHWDACAAKIKHPMRWRKAMLQKYAGAICKGGLDLGQTADLSCLCLVFYDPDTRVWTLLPWFWAPKDTAHRRETTGERVPYLTWARQGWITLTEGTTTDWKKVEKDIVEICGQFTVSDLAVDRLFQGASVCNNLADEAIPITDFGQGYISMAAPVKEFLEANLNGRLHHGGHPVLRWMAANTATTQDAAGNLKFAKDTSTGRIDGIVAATMGIGISLTDPAGSVYDDDSSGVLAL